MSVKVIQVIEVTTKKKEPYTIGNTEFYERTIKEYYDLDGNFLAENDITDKALENINKLSQVD